MILAATGYADQARVDEALDKVHDTWPISILIYDANPAADWAARRGVTAQRFPEKWGCMVDAWPSLVVTFAGSTRASDKALQQRIPVLDVHP